MLHWVERRNMKTIMPYEIIFGIAIRLPFSLRKKEESSYTLFFENTLPKYIERSKQKAFFPTNLNIQKKYREQLDRVMFFTPDISSIYEGFIHDIYDSKEDDDFLDVDLCQEIVAFGESLPVKFKKSRYWIIIEDLKKIGLKEIQQYYVYGTNYSLADKIMEPDFPRIYYTNKANVPIIPIDKIIRVGVAFCPYCGKKLLSENFNYCPYCGSSLRIDNI